MTKILTKDIKKMINKSVVYSVPLYGTKVWTVQKEELR